jgi:hypothetical protein
MNALVTTTSSGLLTVSARRAVSVRVATMADLPFLDAMQKQHGKALGYFPTKQFEGYIAMGGVLVAEEACGSVGVSACRSDHSDTPTPRHPDTIPEKLGYIISRDRYLKRDELGVVYQLCVKAGDQRKLVGATLVREVFERSAYGCKLYCCWCAQDLPANHFWESMGFVPVAFRAGSTGKRRVHIFWQRRINANDVTTPYWYPSMTNQGAIREDRLVFPIPPGTHWSEVEAVAIANSAEPKVLSAEAKPKKRSAQDSAPRAQHSSKPAPLSGALFFAPPAPPKREKPVREKKPKAKVDPKLAAKARELRDRYLEQVNERLLIGSVGKYDVSRALEGAVVALPRLAG